MADVYIAYRQEDAARARAVAARLEREGLSVFWDHFLTPGEEFPVELTREIKAARCVLLLLSTESWRSRWVRAEAHAGVDVLVLARLDDISMPLEMPFNTIQAADIRAWNGTAESAHLDVVVRGVRAKLSGHSTPSQRRETMPSQRGAKRRSVVPLVGVALVAALLALGIASVTRPRQSSAPLSLPHQQVSNTNGAATTAPPKPVEPVQVSETASASQPHRAPPAQTGVQDIADERSNEAAAPPHPIDEEVRSEPRHVEYIQRAE